VHEKTRLILENFGYSSDYIQELDKQQLAHTLKELKLPTEAIAQIDSYEKPSKKTIRGSSSKEVLESLIKRCKKTFGAFSKKDVKAMIIFNKQNWTIFSEDYNKYIQKLHATCKPYFDAAAAKNLVAVVSFTSKNTWKASLIKDELD